MHERKLDGKNALTPREEMQITSLGTQSKNGLLGFTECLLSAKHYFRHWLRSSEQN